MEGSREPVEIVTDHKNLLWWSKVQDLTYLQAR